MQFYGKRVSLLSVVLRVKDHRKPKAIFMDERRVWYLVLGIGVPSLHRIVTLRPRLKIRERIPAAHIPEINRELRHLGITARAVKLERARDGDTGSRYVFRFRRYRRSDSDATRLAECLIFGMYLAGLPVSDSDELPVMRVPDEIVAGGDVISIRALLAVEESREPEDRSANVFSSRLEDMLCQWTITSSATHEHAWRIAATSFGSPALFDALRFMRRSYDNFYVWPGQIRDVAWDVDGGPNTGSGQSRFEEALHSAFKAIEAIIGDPPRDDRRLFEKLRAIGIDPDEEVGYAEKEKISAVIRSMNTARDKKAAHGSTRNRRILPAELLRYQACAEYIVLAGIEKERGCPLDQPKR